MPDDNKSKTEKIEHFIPEDENIEQHSERPLAVNVPHPAEEKPKPKR